jgi:hypothetical protein
MLQKNTKKPLRTYIEAKGTGPAGGGGGFTPSSPGGYSLAEEHCRDPNCGKSCKTM